MPHKTDLKFLLDTNIGIQLEELDQHTGEIKEIFRVFSELCHRHGIKLFHHPDSNLDIDHDDDTVRQKATRSRFKKYPPLKEVPHGESAELEEKFGAIDSSNDLIDCQMLYALSRDCFEYLITNDSGLHRRAKYSGLNERVFTVEEAVAFLRRTFQEPNEDFPNTEFIELSKVDLKDPFFDSLKKDYGPFEKWFKEMQSRGEKCWRVRVGDRIAAICIIQDKGVGALSYRADKKTLKTCTFKVDDDFLGNKYGELLLKCVFSYAIHNGYDLTYLTTFSKQFGLQYLLKEFGFVMGPTPRENGEIEFFKTFYPPPADHPRVDPLDFHRTWYPYFYDDRKIEKVIIPIRPEYHDVLFPEIRTITPLFEDPKKLPPGNTIRKAYLCKSPKKALTKGTLLLFYRTAPESAITTLGLVEETFRIGDAGTLLRVVGKRSVYTVAEMSAMLKKGELLVIKFRLVKHLETPIPYRELESKGILKGRPQSITAVDHGRYLKLKILPG